MMKKVLDQTTQIALLGCLEELELYDESGQLMARLTPEPAYRRKMYDVAHAMFSDEDVERARRQIGQPGRPLAEIMKRLESLNGSVSGRVEAERRTTTG
jgi:hypothetical protein